jgi:transposase
VRLQPLVDGIKDIVLTHRVLHADETPVQMLKPGNKKTHRAYIWTYALGVNEDLKAVIYGFAEDRSGDNARNFVGKWRGCLVCNNFSGYKAVIANGVTEVGCMAHVRRKFFELDVANKSQITDRVCQGPDRSTL